MPNLRGASPVGRDEGGRSYAARADNGEKKTSRRRGGSWKSTGDVVRRCRLEEGEYGGGSSGGRTGGVASRSYLVMRG